MPRAVASRKGLRAPLAHYVLAGIVGIAIASALGTAVALSNGGDFAGAFLITVLAVIYPATALGARMFVTDHTIAADPHGAQSVELQWMQRAGAGAFVDMLVAGIIGGAALILAGADAHPAVPLLTLVALAIADAAVRYLILRHRGA